MASGESRQSRVIESPAGPAKVRILPLWPRRWRLLLADAEHPVWVPVQCGDCGAALSAFIRNPARAWWARLLLRVSARMPRSGLCPEVELPRSVRRAFSFEIPIAGPWQALLRIASGHEPPIAHAVIASFRGEPLACAKVATMPSTDAAVRAEASALAGLAGIPGVSDAVPRLLGSGVARNGRCYVVTSYTGAVRSSRVLTAAHVRFITCLARSHLAVSPFSAAPAKRRLDRALFSLKPCLERATYEALRNALDDTVHLLAGWNGPYVYAHGDFTPDNVRLRRDGVYVINWTSAQGGSNPLADLLHFLITPRAASGVPVSVRVLRRTLDAVGKRAAQIYPEWAWPRVVVAALALAYFVEAILDRCLERRCFDATDLRVRAYWPLIENRAHWCAVPRPAFQRVLRRIPYCSHRERGLDGSRSGARPVTHAT